MAQKQKYRAPQLTNIQRACEEEISSARPGEIRLHKEIKGIEEKQSYAMVMGLIQVLVQMHSPEVETPPANLVVRHQGG